VSDLRKIGALWRNISKSTGGTFYSGKLDAEAVKSALAGDEVRLLLFPVKNKRENGPDVELFAAPDTRREATPARASRVDDIDDVRF
jgi:hypothetical protein